MPFLGFELIQNAPLFIPSSKNGVSLPYIPGSIIKNFLKEKGFDLKVLNAYPVCCYKRALPVPFSWVWHEDARTETLGDGENLELEHAIFDMAAYAKAATAAIVQGDKDAKLPEGYAFLRDLKDWFYIILKDEQEEYIELVRPRYFITEELSPQGVPYMALKPKNVFKGLVWIDGDNAKKIAQNLRKINDVLYTGIKSHRGFGGALQIKWDRNLIEDEFYRFSDEVVEGGIKKGQILRLVAASDLYIEGDIVAELNKALDSELELLRVFGTPAKYEKGLVYPGGTVITLISNQDISEEKVKAIEVTGLGDKLEEGNGRVVVLKKVEEGMQYAYTMPLMSEAIVQQAMPKEAYLTMINGLLKRAANLTGYVLAEDIEPALKYEEFITLWGAVGTGQVNKKLLKEFNSAAKIKGTELGSFITDVVNGNYDKTLRRDLEVNAIVVRKKPYGVPAMSNKEINNLMVKIRGWFLQGLVDGIRQRGAFEK